MANAGFIKRVIRKLTRKYAEERIYRNFYKGVKHPSPTKGKVLIYAGIGHMYLTPLEILMYHLLRKEGFDVDYYIYDESVSANEVITKQVIETKGKTQFWNASVSNASRALKAAGVSFRFITKSSQVDDLITPVKGDLNAILNFSYDGVDFGHIIKGVLFRFYKSLTFGPDVDQVAYNFLETSLTNYLQVRGLHKSQQYSVCFFSHGIYCTWQPVVEYCTKYGLKYICYDRAKKGGSANFNVNQPSPDWSFNKAWERYLDRPLTNEEEMKVSEYLGERELQKGDVYSYNFSAKAADINDLKKQLGIPEGRKVITIFTNLIWDAANVARDIAFPSAMECILQTIRYFSGNEKVQVVIRSHPAEKVLGTKERYGSLVKQAFNGVLPDNVTIIEPEMDVNSFSVIEMSDIGVVNTSTVGLEFAIMAKPIILISETNYRNKGFTYDALSKEHYFETIEALLTTGLLLPRQVELARKYFYMMMFLYQKQMPVNYKNGQFGGYNYVHFNKIPVTDQLVPIIVEACKKNNFDFIFWS